MAHTCINNHNRNRNGVLLMENTPQPERLPDQTPTEALQVTENIAPATLPVAKKRRWLGLAVLAAVLATIGGIAVFVLGRDNEPIRSTYFTYPTVDTKGLGRLKSTDTIQTYDAFHWNQQAFQLVSSHKVDDVDASRIYAYLAVAQQDFATLSFNAKGSFAGSINPVSSAVLCQFFPANCSDLKLDETHDALTNAITPLVIAQVKSRINADTSATQPFTLRTDKDLWSGPSPQTGIDAGSRKPWHLASGSQFRVAAPPSITSDTYADLLREVTQSLSNITDKQRNAVVFWAGGPGTKTPPGIWLSIADQHMKDQNTPLDTILKVHADTSTAMADAVIAVFDSKYTHQLKRPVMLDPKIVTVMPTPNHPGYPAGHATISAAAYTVLSHYFPSHTSDWKSQADEASDSRLWGGIHFSTDNTVGFELGQKVGKETLKHYSQ